MTSVLGTRLPRTEDRTLLTRGARYVADLDDPALTGAAHAVFVRSTMAHARISGIDTSAAGELPGVVGVYTAADLDVGPYPTVARAPREMIRPLLATDVVRFVGEPVAVVLVDDPYLAEDAAEAVWVDYEPLPSLLDPLQAVQDEVLLFPDAGTNITQAHAGDGDPDLFAGCEVVVEGELVNHRVAPCPLEVRSTAAAWDGDAVTAWISTQSAHSARGFIAGALGVEPEQVRVVVGDVGGAFGSKINLYPEDLVVVWAARRLGRPVRWLETRSEQMASMGHGRAQMHRFRIGGSRDGRIQAYRLEVTQDSGAYPALGSNLAFFTAMMAAGTYDIERVETSTRAVVTTTCPTEAYRGAGRPEATYTIERAIDMFAAEAGLDPAEVRSSNFVPDQAFPYTTATGVTYDTGAYGEALRRVLDTADYQGLRAEQQARRDSGHPVQMGIGISAYVEITAGPTAGAEHAKLTLRPDGHFELWTGASPHGQGHQTGFAMVAADALGVEVDQVQVRWGDTAEMPDGVGTFGSRTLQLGGAAALEAARRLVDVAKEDAAVLLESPAYEIDFADGRFRVPSGGSVGWAEIAGAIGPGGITVTHQFEAPTPTFPFGAHLVVVDVDTETGKVDLVRVVACDDAGRILNPLLAEGQRHGGLAQGLAQALLEEVRYDDMGNPTTTSFADYEVITAPELPAFELVDLETPTPANPLGAKGIGESGTIGVTPALVNAVVDALSPYGIRHLDMPCTPQRVWAAIRAASGAHA